MTSAVAAAGRRTHALRVGRRAASPTTGPTTTWSGASPSATSATCSSCSSSRAPRPASRGGRSCASATATGGRSRASTPAAVAAFGEADIERLLADPGSCATGQDRVGDRQRAGDARAPGGGLDASSTTCGRSSAARRSSTPGRRWATIPAETDESRAMSKDLKARGFRFVGPTICYALMQSAGPRQRPRRQLLPLRRGPGSAG